MNRTIPAVLAGLALAASLSACGGSPTETETTSVVPQASAADWTNCASVNKTYPHGVGKDGAVDKTSGTPVTTFQRSDAVYATAIKENGSLDRDDDGIACEKD